MFYKIMKVFVTLYYRVRHKITVIGENNIPKEGPVLLAANHKSLHDPPAIGISVKREMSFFAKSELFKNKLFGAAIRNLNAIPVNRGKGDRAALKTSIEALKEGRMLLMFPEGTRNKDKKDELRPLQEGASFIAMSAKAPIVPVAVRGNYDDKNGVTIIFGQPIYTDELRKDGLKRKDITKILENNLNNLLNGPLHLDK
ncbi:MULTISPECIES: lysophospholipid acyltransferase family protein [Nosocomiicoccus]|uniref:1-acyl-sn-glycerol-3-phosphate acyltransferase n=1 Tax=Nosocomiicoccus massiliensis TaxID=1232430 RepID=A0AAF0YML5_9STAP|nr:MULTISPECIES: lysophospholipid acyltransferase family protein [Nosocomiicoccus]OFL46115.1 acyl-phosphate glycerol 3-phosphate acyltransferase [Nosocomiicoccus sp. HMSC067E10]OFS64234.1 acyl-phosphate glycerol 3-phosphate acyltransferase [Nosocomiicoccus sp. HMSC09A07]WOS96524.1 lysophospholipid acyltransferase family protein [Nosocomiicoccus massiliensis]